MAVCAAGCPSVAAGQRSATVPQLRAAGVTSRVSVDSSGNEADKASHSAAISADGRYVAFASAATNLVPDDTNLAVDMFVRDLVTGATERVSIGPGGTQADGRSYVPAISADGRYVAFWSEATNLVAGGTAGAIGVFVHDLVTGATRKVVGVPAGSATSHRVAISAGGRYVAFDTKASGLVPSDDDRLRDVFVRDRVAHTTRRVSVGRHGIQANDGSSSPSMSADGRYVGFESDASNLVAQDSNNDRDVFVWNRVAHTTRRVSVGPHGIQANHGSLEAAISSNGRYVAFASAASNLVAGDSNRDPDIFVRDRVADTTRRVSVGPGGAQGDKSSYVPAVSANGRYIAFTSAATNLVAGDSNGDADVFVRDRVAHATRRVSVGLGGAQVDGGGYLPAISATGRYVVFESDATQLVAGDTNDSTDIFLHDRRG
jgi:Tol biopolymer transport system component